VKPPALRAWLQEPKWRRTSLRVGQSGYSRSQRLLVSGPVCHCSLVGGRPSRSLQRRTAASRSSRVHERLTPTAQRVRHGRVLRPTGVAALPEVGAAARLGALDPAPVQRPRRIAGRTADQLCPVAQREDDPLNLPGARRNVIAPARRPPAHARCARSPDSRKRWKTSARRESLIPRRYRRPSQDRWRTAVSPIAGLVLAQGRADSITAFVAADRGEGPPLDRWGVSLERYRQRHGSPRPGPGASTGAALARHFRDEEGLSIAEVARHLGRAEATIKAYLYDPS
jgi:hypothetical protein